MKGIKLVIFDFDGTIGDTKDLIIKAMFKAKDRWNWTLPSVRECEEIIGLPLKEGFRKIFPGLTEEQLDRRCSEYRTYFMDNCMELVPNAFPHVEETLPELKSRGMRLTIASSRHKSSLTQYLGGMKLLHFFEYIVGPEDVAQGKPSPDPVLKTLEMLGHGAGESIVVGDTSYDILMGVRAGVHTCGVSYGVGTVEQLEAAGAGYVVNDFADILSVIAEIEKKQQA